MAKIAKRKTVVCIAIFMASSAAILPSEVHAQAARSLSVGGIGRETCATWTSAREGTSEDSKLDSQRRVEWLNGFFTAINFTQPSGNLHGSIDDQDGMLIWIDAHCRANPGEPLFAATIDLVFDLKNHPRK